MIFRLLNFVVNKIISNFVYQIRLNNIPKFSKTMAINKSKLFNIAWAIIRKGEADTFSTALRLAWKASKIYAGMLTGTVEFSFKKVNGEIRKAIGTLTDIDYTPKGTGKPQSEEAKKRNADVLTFFDVEKRAFRSFRAATLL